MSEVKELLIQPKDGDGYWSIVKHMDMDHTYGAGCGNHLVATNGFRSLGIRTNVFTNRSDLERVIKQLIEFNPTVNYGAAWIKAKAHEEENQNNNS